ncbi:MAG: peroxiredoxin [Gemmatimonadaceae bacterium]|jgi:peroxiredoxin Q/BCP|nr:peroxiredoxin [Gemmatimonadaceae bacterium]
MPAKKKAAVKKPVAKKPAAKKPAAKKPAAKKPAAKTSVAKKPAAKKPAAKKPAAKKPAVHWDVPPMPAVGTLAPDISLPTDTGESLALSSLRGTRVVLYFYPKDDTTGCTAEACEFRDTFPRFTGADTVILGVSPDPVKSHQKFKAKYQLPFTLLADEAKQAALAFGVWVEKSMYGNRYWANARTTFLIGRDGRIARIFEKVDPVGHAAQVSAALAELP